MIRLSAEHGLKGPQMAAIVHEREAMGRSWLKRYLAQGIEGLQDTPRSGRPAEITAVYRTALLAAGRLVLLYLPTYSPWLDPIEMWWRQFRRAVTHSEFCVSVAALVKVAHAFFDRYNHCPHRVPSIIGRHAV